MACFIAASAAAADLGRAEGALTIDKTRVGLAYAYAIGRRHNDITKRKDDIKVVLTDKALAADFNLNEIDATLPPDYYAVRYIEILRCAQNDGLSGGCPGHR